MNGGGPFTRYSLAGWVFVVVTLASLAFSNNQGPWRTLTASISAGGDKSSAAVLTAVLGIIAGLSAPPAVGYVLTRATSLTEWVIGQNAEHHAIFYSRASQPLIDWERERMTQVLASQSCVLAGIAAVLFVGVAFGAWACWVIVVTAILAALLELDARYSDRQRRKMLNYWHDHRAEFFESALARRLRER